MAMSDEDVLAELLVVQSHPFTGLNSVEKVTVLIGVWVSCFPEDILDFVRVSKLHVVIAIDDGEAVLSIEVLIDVKDILMSIENMTEMPVFPELIPIPIFNQMKIILKVVVDGV